MEPWLHRASKIKERPAEHKPAPWLALLACVLCAGVAGSAHAADDDDDDAPAPVRQAVTGAGLTLDVPVAVQAQAGIAVARLERAQLLPEREVQAQVLDLGPLLDARWQYRDAAAQGETAQAALARTQAALDRLESLRRNPDDVSGRQLLEARTARDEAAAQVRAAQARLDAQRESLQRHWGADVSALVLAGGEMPFAGQGLLLVATGVEPQADAVLRVAVPGSAGVVVAALVGPAPLPAAGLPGVAWFATVPGSGFRAGANVRGWLSTATQPQTGVMVPRSAVVWHGGAPWVYRRVDTTHFARVGMAGGVDQGEQWFVPVPGLAGSDVVVTGAQTLLSEEQRAQIPDEDDDP